MIDAGLATRLPVRLVPSPSRVVTRLFVAGQEVVGGAEGRASEVVDRVLALEEAVVREELAELLNRFEGRHRDLLGTFRRNAERVEGRLRPSDEPSEARRLLLGASFTHEYAVEAAALCNPSVVAHPDQSGVAPGALRFVMSVRGIGEGHRSSIGFRTGLLHADGAVTVDDPGPFAQCGRTGPVPLAADVFRGRLQSLGADGESTAFVLDALGPDFTAQQLEARLDALEAQHDTRRDALLTTGRIRAIAACGYRTTFPTGTPLAEQVLAPAMALESHGVEDARFVRFVDDDGTVAYHATYTAFDGARVSQQLLRTEDFTEFTSGPIVGSAATDKGMALFPRRIDGRVVALSRHDRETNALAFSDSLARWDDATTIHAPQRSWEVIQVGNCGSPIETEAGWLVLTHGVGPMRTYSIGAMLLDLDDPSVVLGDLPLPLLAPAADERDGYVPNVVYSCGSLLHGDTLLIPYGTSDTAIGFATARCSEVLDALVSVGAASTRR